MDDLRLGQSYESIARTLIGGSNVEIAPNKRFSDWDFKSDGVAYEVKSDRRAYQTGNLCIEYEHTQVPSGISITKADYWIYFVICPEAVGYKVYKIPVSVIKEAVEMAPVRTWYTDGGNSKFYLVPSFIFKDYLMINPQNVTTV
jgi:hypothetical protein